jgi:NAD(P)H-dependent FMN reductase
VCYERIKIKRGLHFPPFALSEVIQAARAQPEPSYLIYISHFKGKALEASSSSHLVYMQRLRESIGGKNRLGGTKAERVQLALSAGNSILDQAISSLSSLSTSSGPPEKTTAASSEKMAASNSTTPAAPATKPTPEAPVSSANPTTSAAAAALAAEEAVKTFKVGVILGSNRKPARAGPQITQFVWDTIAAHQKACEAMDGSRTKVEMKLIDIDELDLPFFNEPLNPAAVKKTEQYTHEYTKSWSRTVYALDAFVFVTPQYNWGIPAGLKNAIDFLYHEWLGKSAMIVSYGGHGGDKSAQALKVVLGGGLKMKVNEKAVNLSFPGPGRDFLMKANFGEDLGLDAKKEEGLWHNYKPEIIAGWQSMLVTLDSNVSEE